MYNVFGFASAAFVVGLLSGLHCGAMCGGLLAAIAKGEHRYAAALHAGRIASYTLAGGLVGGLGGALAQASAAHTLHMVFMLVANVLLILAGLNLAGIAAATRALERMGQPLWRRLQPLLARLLPLNSAPRALAAGALWGWLPCGMVYAVLPSSLATGDALMGALVMLAFGFGTLPNLLALTFFWGKLQRSSALAQVRLGAGLAVAGVGVAGLGMLAMHFAAMQRMH